MNYTRRKLLKQLLSSSLGISLLPSPLFSINNKSKSYLDNIGLQLWTVRNEIVSNPAATLSKVAALGYKQLEGMNLPQVVQLKEQAADFGLDIHSSFFQWSYLTNNWELANKRGIQKIKGVDSIDHLIELANKSELRNLTFGYLFEEERSLEDFKKWSDALNITGEKCKKAGITLSYHNHDFEFVNHDGTNAYQLLIDRLDPKLVQFELDIFWVKVTGHDPLQLLKQLDGRVSFLHLKDLKSSPSSLSSNIPPDQFVPLGKGIIDLPSILDEANKQNIKYCFVEQDQSDNPLNSIKDSILWLQQYYS